VFVRNVLPLTSIMAQGILILVLFQTLQCHCLPIVPRCSNDKYHERDLNVTLKPSCGMACDGLSVYEGPHSIFCLIHQGGN
jgi:hypothetical protein